MTGWPWPLDAVQGFFTSSFSTVFSWIDSAIDQIWGFFTWLRDRVSDIGKAISDRVWGFITWVRDQLWDRILWLKDQVWGFFDWLRIQIAALVSGMAAAAGTIAATIWSQLGPTLSGLWDKVWGGLSWLWNEKIWPGLTWLAGELKTRILDPTWGFFVWLKDQVIWPGLEWLRDKVILPGLDKLTGGLSGLFLWFMGELTNKWDPRWGEAMKELTGIRTAFNGAMAGLPDVLKTELKPIGDFFGSLTLEKLQGAVAGLQDQMNSWASRWQTDILGTTAGGSPMTPEEAASRVPTIIGSGLAAEIGVDILGIAVEALGVGQLETPCWALGSLLRTLGIEGIVSKTINMRVEKGIWIPYARFLNKEIRPEVLAPRLMDQAYWQDNVGLQAWRDAYAYSGIPEPIIDAWYKSMWEPPRPYDLIRAGEVGIEDRAWADRALKARGMSPVDREIMLEMIDRRSVIGVIGMVRSEAIKDYAEGNIEMPELQAILTRTWHNARQMELLIDYAKSLEDDYYRKEWIQLHIESFKKGQIDEKGLRANLANLIKDPDRLNRKVMLEVVKKMKLAPAETTSQQRISFSSVVVTRFKEGFIDRARMNQELAMLQSITDPMALAAYVGELSYDTDFKIDQAKAYDELYLKDLIDEEEWGSFMVPIVVVDPKRAARLAYLIARKYKKPKIEKPAPA